MREPKSRTWAEINLKNLRENFINIRDSVKEYNPVAKVLAVIKADAYGHGAVVAAREYIRLGADFFGVATLEEALELREAGIDIPLLILGYVPPEDAPVLAQHQIATALTDSDGAKAFSAAAQAAGVEVPIHIALNTGMTRIGFETRDTEQGAEEIVRAISLPGIQAEGIFTHFCVADVDGGEEFTALQYQRFRDMCAALDRRGVSLRYRHCANSAAILQHRHTFAMTLPDEQPVFNMVRAGIILYGYYPDATTQQLFPLKPVMTVKARVAQLRQTPTGETVGYGRTYETDKPTTLAVITMGYADGYHRYSSGKAKVVIGGQVVPVVGRICMDMCMVDVTGLDVHRDDEAIIFGDCAYTADDAAQAAGTISYEVLCAIARRVPRVYIQGNPASFGKSDFV